MEHQVHGIAVAWAYTAGLETLPARWDSFVALADVNEANNKTYDRSLWKVEQSIVKSKY
jgi:hypothetical protein